MSALVDHLMDAQAANARQDRVLYDPSPETDSALEHLLAIAKTATPEQRPHIRALIRCLGEARHLNAAEREHERAAAAVADPVSSVHEFAKLVRPLLADLMHPFVGEQRRRARLLELHALFGRTLPRTRRAFSCRPLLGVSKFTELVIRLDEWEGRDDVDRVPPAGLTAADLGVSL